MDSVDKFMALFDGRQDAHGVGVGRIEKTPPVRGLYELHLKGAGSGLGVFPLRNDGTVRFAAIDIDKPDFELAAQLQLLLPGSTWIERSRSGNAHVWAFFNAPIEGWVARGLMKFALEAVGEPNVEVFPKQDSLKEGMVGNYINLPWHGIDRPIISIHPDGSSLSWDRDIWLNTAYAERIDPEEWRVRAGAVGIKAPDLREASMAHGELPFLHDCATYILANKESNPVRSGHRSVVYFSVACQLLNYREMDEDTARELLHELNAAADPPADEREVDRIMDNAIRGGFTGTGCDNPIMAPYVRADCKIAHG